MSDPGITYRTRNEIKHVRDHRDPLKIVKYLLIENNWCSEKELKEIEKEIKLSIEKDVEKAL